MCIPPHSGLIINQAGQAPGCRDKAMGGDTWPWGMMTWGWGGPWGATGVLWVLGARSPVVPIPVPTQCLSPGLGGLVPTCVLIPLLPKGVPSPPVSLFLSPCLGVLSSPVSLSPAVSPFCPHAQWGSVPPPVSSSPPCHHAQGIPSPPVSLSSRCPRTDVVEVDGGAVASGGPGAVVHGPPLGDIGLARVGLGGTHQDADAVGGSGDAQGGGCPRGNTVAVTPGHPGGGGVLGGGRHTFV